MTTSQEMDQQFASGDVERRLKDLERKMEAYEQGGFDTFRQFGYLQLGLNLPRFDSNGIQIQSTADVPGIYWVNAFQTDPLNYYPHGAALGFGTLTNAKAAIEAAYTVTEFAKAQVTSGATDGSRMTLTATNGTEQAIVTLRGTNKSSESIGVTDLFSSLSFSNPVSVSIVANQDDWNPTNNYGSVSFRVITDASRDITGITNGRPGNGGGRLLFIMNAGANNLVLKDASGLSTAANQFALKADITIAPDGGVALLYDVISSRWRCVGEY